MYRQQKNKVRRGPFVITPLSIITNPMYIIRNGLYKTISEFAPKIAGDVLDFGCGSKPYESLFSNARNYTGVDIEISGHGHQDSKIDVFYDGKALPFPNNHFDAVVCFEVFEHVFNLDEIIIEIKLVLKPRGLLLISIPFAWGEHEIPYDFARYTSYGLRYILEKNMLDVLELRKTTTYVSAVCQLFIAYLAEYVSPKGKLTQRLFQLCVIFPLNVASAFLNCILPKRYDYFCNSVILSEKR
ncbi:MAG: class I SAM-dependent methyltransferase [Pseudomonadota bacterium]